MRKPDESGMDELLRLSREISTRGQQQSRAKQERAERRQAIQGMQQGLREIKLSVALEQLKLLAEPRIVARVEALRQKPGTAELRKLIVSLSDSLEQWSDNVSRSKPEMSSVVRSVKTLAILIELLFSLE